MSQIGFIFHRLLRDLLLRRHLPQPDGRQLHLYRLTQEEYESLRAALTRACHHQDGPEPNAVDFCAAFCLFVSEWFKRSFEGGHWSWERPCAEIGWQFDPTLRPKVVTNGLGWWGLEIQRGNGNDHQWLYTLVLQGGLPTPFISGQAGWLRDFAARVIREIEASSSLSPEAPMRLAWGCALSIPASFRKEPLIRLVAELAEALVHLRHQVGNVPDVVAALDASNASWRESLPVTLDDAAVRSFIHGLVRTGSGRPDRPVLVERRIGRNHGALCFGLALHLDGLMSPVQVPELGHPAIDVLRMRLMPSGALAEEVRGCLAILDQPDENRNWKARSLLNGRSTLLPFPINAEASASLVAERETFAVIILPGGRMIDDEVLVFRATDPEGNRPDDLSLLGTGSLRTREPVLFLAVRDAAAQSFDAATGTLEPVDEIENYTLFRVTGTVRIRTTEGLSYRIVTGAQEETGWRLDPSGDILPDLSARVPVFRGLPRFRRFDAGGLIRRVEDKTLRWRFTGRRDWQPIDRDRPPFGTVEIAAFDKDETVQARLRLGVVPPDAKVRRAVSGRTPSVEVSGFLAEAIRPRLAVEGLSLSPNGEDAVLLSAESDTRPPRSVPVIFCWREGGTLDAELPLVGSHIAFHDAQGLRIADRSRRSLPSLRGATVEASGQAVLRIALVHGGRRDDMLTRERRFEGSLPLAYVRSDVLDLMACSRDIDSQIRLEACGVGPDIRIDIQRFDLAFEPDEAAVVLRADALASLPGSAMIEIVGRPFRRLLDPERQLATATAGEAEDLRVEVPDGEGPWLIYARVGGSVQSRPILLSRPMPDDEAPSSGLIGAMLKSPRERTDTIDCCLTAMAAGDGEEDLAFLGEMIREFSGQLPLQTFEVLRRLCHVRDVGVALLATEQVEPDEILALSRELPFWWQLTSFDHWGRNFLGMKRRICAMFAGSNLQEDIQLQLVAQMLGQRLARIESLEPTLAIHVSWTRFVLGLADASDAGRLFRMAGAFPQAISGLVLQTADECVRRNADRRWPQPEFRSLRQDLPEELRRFDAETLDVLDAPHLAAAVACGLAMLLPKTEQHLRACRYFDPLYFNDAFQFAVLRLHAASPFAQPGPEEPK